MSETFGEWQLDSLVAVGGLGEVWRGQRGDQVAAVKRLHTHLARNEEALRQFSVEQRLATTLPPHRNVVRGFESGEVIGRPYLAMELLPGEDLRRLVAPPIKQDAAPSQVLLPRTRALQIVLAACDG